MPEKILYVDDEPNLLASFQRTFGRRFEIRVADGGQEGLKVLAEDAAVAVVLSDMRMPGMDGVTFLSTAKERSPDVVCMMLTGYADVQTTMKAVNEGRIFRFLTKPCTPELLTKALEAGLQQYRLVMAEKELLQRTLTGSIQVLTEILSLVNPTAFSRTLRLRSYARRMASSLHLQDVWQYELAAMLSQIGCVTLPPAVTDKLAAGKVLVKEEQQMVQAHPALAAKLLGKIPRMQTIARMIEHQADAFDPAVALNAATPEGAVHLGAQLLRLLIALDTLLVRGLPAPAAVELLRRKAGEYPPHLLEALQRVAAAEAAEAPPREVKELTLGQLLPGMYAVEDIVAQTGALLVPRGQEITETLLLRLRNFDRGVPVREPIRVACPARPTGEARDVLA